MAHTHIRPLSALALAAALAAGAVLPGHARAAGAPHIPRVVSCPAGTVCDASLGVALPLPAGWTRDNYPAGALEFSARPTAGATYRVVRLNIASWGTTSDRDDARVAAAGMDALIRETNSARSFARVPVHILGAAGVLVSGLPGSPGSVTAIILARAGGAYKILAPGATLAPDQRQALDSLRFIPRVGPFPPANGVGVPPTAPAPATSAASLTVTIAPLTTELAVRTRGTGFQTDALVTLRVAWTGVPRPGQRPRYTHYTTTRSVRADQAGVLDATLDIPVPPRAYASYTVRVNATSGRAAARSATFVHAHEREPVAKTRVS